MPRSWNANPAQKLNLLPLLFSILFLLSGCDEGVTSGEAVESTLTPISDSDVVQPSPTPTPSATPAATPTPTPTPAPIQTSQWVQMTGSGMNYYRYVPSAALTQRPALMINLHGCSQNAAMYRDRGNWAATAESFNMIVVIPDVPNGGVNNGCWSFYGANHSDSSGHSGAVVSLTQALLADTTFNIMASKVFISGLSSGAGEALVLGCLRPDLYKGVGLAAGPTLDSDYSQPPQKTVTQTAQICRNLAGSRTAAFATQKVSIIYDQADNIVNYQQATMNNNVFRQIFGISSNAVSFSLAGLQGANQAGSGAMSSDSGGDRVSIIQNTNLGHSWPAGNGAPYSYADYINPYSVNYPRYLASFFMP